MERARAVLAEDRILRLTPHEAERAQSHLSDAERAGPVAVSDKPGDGVAR